MNPAPAKAVVIVDDERSYLELLAQVLGENLACPIRTYSRPLAVLAALPALSAGVVVTDYFMPDLTGLELIRRARAVRPDLPFILITGNQLNLTPEEFAQFPSLRAVLHKPFDWRVLAAQIIRCWPDARPPALRASLSSV